MKRLRNEIAREMRWAVSSRLFFAVTAATLVFAGWSAVSDVGNASSAAAQFERTAEAYATAGQSVQEALEAPLNVQTDANGQSNIDNPVRYDLEAALAASGALAPTGSISTALSLALFIFVPLLSYAVGLFVITSDLKSGSIITRWPQVKDVRIFVTAKVVLLLTVSLILGVTLVVWSALAGLVTKQMQALPVGALPNTAAPGVGQGIGLLAVLVLVSAVFSSLGAFVGSLTRERVFSLVVFALGYYLMPILGSWDVRNFIPGVAGDLLTFYGGFQPHSIGDIDPASGALALAILTVLTFLGSGLTWAIRDRTPANI